MTIKLKWRVTTLTDLLLAASESKLGEKLDTTQKYRNFECFKELKMSNASKVPKSLHYLHYKLNNSQSNH